MIDLVLRTESDLVLRQFADEMISVGRSPENHLVIRDPRVSRLHARIERAGPLVRLVDLKSGNGTRLNGMKIDTSPLKAGDTLEIGPTRWRVLHVEAAVPSPKVDAPSQGETQTATRASSPLRARRPFRRGKPRFLSV